MKLYKDELRSVMYVDDLDATADYYSSVMGLEKVYEWDNGPEDRGCKFKVVGGGYIELLCRKPIIEQGATSLWMEAKDIDGMFSTISKNPKAGIFEAVADKYYHARVFRVVDPDGNTKTFEIQSEKKTVGEALMAEGLIEGEEGPYGLYVKTVNGTTLDYETHGMYWAFYIDGEYGMSACELTDIVDGTEYAFKAEK